MKDDGWTTIDTTISAENLEARLNDLARLRDVRKAQMVAEALAKRQAAAFDVPSGFDLFAALAEVKS